LPLGQGLSPITGALGKGFPHPAFRRFRGFFGMLRLGGSFGLRGRIGCVSTDSGSRKAGGSVPGFLEMKRSGKKIVALTAYDFLFSRYVEEARVDLILIGDSLGQVVLGYDSTIPVTLEEMIHHGKAVRRGAPDSFLVLDMPFLSYQVSPEDALRNAGRAVKETRVEAVKVEGASASICRSVETLVQAGIPVMGHIGLTPQSVHALGGYRVQGRGEAAAERLKAQARALEDAGCFSIVLELVPSELGREISESLTIPTIGIGAGPHCDGQVLVLFDALGLTQGFQPRFLKRFGELEAEVREALLAYVREVREGTYPGPEHSFPDQAE
jgi:3-methyl-2-oxobutanoate hydroxymethyltransferase